MAYGITETGFVRPSFEEIRANKIQEYQNAFGADIDITESSVYGQFINNQSLKEAFFWELMESIYNSFNPDSAFGTSLDAIGQFVVVGRLGATKTKLEAEIIYGPVGTNIPLNHMVGQSSGYNFKSDTAFTITNLKAADVYVEIPGTRNIFPPGNLFLTRPFRSSWR